MTEKDKKIANLELEIAFFKNEIQKTNKLNMELTQQLRIAGVSNRLIKYCDSCEHETEHRIIHACLLCDGHL